MSPSVPTAPTRRRDRAAGGRQGTEGGSAGPDVQRGHRRRLHRTGVQPRRHDRRRRAGRGPAVARGDDPRLPADALHRGGLPAAQPGRPRLRHDVHLGDPRVRAAHRVDGRLGHRGGGRHRHGQPGRDRRPVRLPARRRWTACRQHLRDDGGRGPVDRADDLDLLHRHRALRARAVRPARDRGDHARRRLGRRARAGLDRTRRPHLDPAVVVVVQPVPGPVGERARRRRAAGRVHLLGLGHRRLGERGDQGPGAHPGSRGGPVHRCCCSRSTAWSPWRPRPSPASATPGSASATPTTPETCCRCSATPSSARASSAPD